MSLKCTGCGAVVDESHIRFCRIDHGDHICGSLMMPYEAGEALADDPTSDTLIEEEVI